MLLRRIPCSNKFSWEFWLSFEQLELDRYRLYTEYRLYSGYTHTIYRLELDRYRLYADYIPTRTRHI